jgi:cell division protein FtsL
MMKKKYFALYVAVLTIPLFLALTAWQSFRYAGLKQEIKRLEQTQADWIESNKRLIAGIAVLSSARRIEHIARTELKMVKIKPENVSLVKIEGGKGREF